MGIVKPSNPDPGTHILQQSQTPNLSQTVPPNGDEIFNYRLTDDILIQTITVSVTCNFIFQTIQIFTSIVPLKIMIRPTDVHIYCQELALIVSI